jgi:hypothetical protein
VLSCRVLRVTRRRPARAASRPRVARSAPPMRFAPLQRFPARGSSDGPGLPHPTRLRPQVFATSRRLHPPCACRPCFMPDPLMGLRPPELCSSRAAVRRSRRLIPSCRSLPSDPVPDAAEARAAQPVVADHAPKHAAFAASAVRANIEVGTHGMRTEQDPKTRRLQGFAPRESPPPLRGWFRPVHGA